jgi:hypothetical protein
MEQRSSVRKTARIGVVVSCPQFGLFRGEIENVSMEGGYVRTRNVHVCLNAPVTLTFQPEPALPLLNCTAAGVVVHQDADGVGIRFGELDPVCRAALGNLLQRSDQAA